uniref:Ovule protein n=1 Tax=Elaeophora elaphi TaxID=1147741 RepID=A0A0R3RME5_9BILA
MELNTNKFLAFPTSLQSFPLWSIASVWYKVERVKAAAYVLYKSVQRRNDSIKDDCGNVSLLQSITIDFLGSFYGQKLNSLPR